MSELQAAPAAVPLLKYRSEPPRVSFKEDPKVSCPFCLQVQSTNCEDIATHIPKCLCYDPFRDGLPTAPATAVKISDGYSLADYFEDETLYFNTLTTLIAGGQLADAPTDSVDTLLDYISSFLSLMSTTFTLSPLRLKSLAWRILNAMFEMNEEAVEHMLGFLNTLADAGDTE